MLVLEVGARQAQGDQKRRSEGGQKRTQQWAPRCCARVRAREEAERGTMEKRRECAGEGRESPDLASAEQN